MKYSKVDSRPADAAVEPEASTSTQANPVQVPVKSIESVLRSIARTVDDPLSGSTLDLNFISPPTAESKPDEPDEWPTPIDFTTEATNLKLIRSVQLPARPRQEPIEESIEGFAINYELIDRFKNLNFVFPYDIDDAIYGIDRDLDYDNDYD